MNSKPEKLKLEIFNLVIKHTPLISIDLIVTNQHEQIMLGWRRNHPAKNHWFVPGGRILKNETIRHAFQRIADNELGLSLSLHQTSFMGVYEHIHSHENFSNEEGYGTHYIVMAFELNVPERFKAPPGDQHTEYKWFNLKDLLSDSQVHRYTKDYFNDTVPVK